MLVLSALSKLAISRSKRLISWRSRSNPFRNIDAGGKYAGTASSISSETDGIILSVDKGKFDVVAECAADALLEFSAIIFSAASMLALASSLACASSSYQRLPL